MATGLLLRSITSAIHFLYIQNRMITVDHTNKTEKIKRLFGMYFICQYVAQMEHEKAQVEPFQA